MEVIKTVRPPMLEFWERAESHGWRRKMRLRVRRITALPYREAQNG